MLRCSSSLCGATALLLVMLAAGPALAAAPQMSGPPSPPGAAGPATVPVSTRPPPLAPLSLPAPPTLGIVAVVNGDVVSQVDVEARARLFALSTNLPFTPDVLARLRPQVTSQLIDERLRLQEEQRRKVVVNDKQIAESIANIESRNGMQPGMLRRKLGEQGVALRTLIDQVRVQIGWNQVLRQELGERLQVSDTDIAEQQAIMKARAGQAEYHVAEIFLPVEDPSKSGEIQHFADSVAQQLRTGAPFPVVAAQFSQSQTALQGGEMGWVRPGELDPQVAALVTQMPEGAISNPIEVPGGFAIVEMVGKREVGRDMATMLTVRQVFLPFTAPLNPAAPTEQQRKALETATQITKNVHGCDAMEAANKANGATRPSDPGELRLETINGPLRALLTSLPPGEASKPLVSSDGIGVVMICSSVQKNVAEDSRQDISNRLVNERVELMSRQLVRDLRRRAVIDQRG